MITMSISRFTVLDTLDHEGRSVVYLAEDTANKRKVAVKLMAGRLSSDPKARRRFEREAQNAAELALHGFVEIYESGVHEGRPFVAMEYVDGRTLTSLLGAGGPMKFPDMLRLAKTLGEALQFAHSRGVHSLAITCSNIMISKSGEVRILELGLTEEEVSNRAMLEAAPPEVAVNWSPEMTRGQPSGPPSDFWRLGLILYECLTGRPPFTGSSTPILFERIRETEPKRPTALRTGTPAPLERVILRCLEKDPASRYATAEELLVDLGVPVSAMPVAAAPVEAAPVAAAAVPPVPKAVIAPPAAATPLEAVPVSAAPAPATPIEAAPVVTPPVAPPPVSRTPVTEAPVVAAPVVTPPPVVPAAPPVVPATTPAVAADAVRPTPPAPGPKIPAEPAPAPQQSRLIMLLVAVVVLLVIVVVLLLRR